MNIRPQRQSSCGNNISAKEVDGDQFGFRAPADRQLTRRVIGGCAWPAAIAHRPWRAPGIRSEDDEDTCHSPRGNRLPGDRQPNRTPRCGDRRAVARSQRQARLRCARVSARRHRGRNVSATRGLHVPGASQTARGVGFSVLPHKLRGVGFPVPPHKLRAGGPVPARRLAESGAGAATNPLIRPTRAAVPACRPRPRLHQLDHLPQSVQPLRRPELQRGAIDHVGHLQVGTEAGVLEDRR
jgi:hypothetical protein